MHNARDPNTATRDAFLMVAWRVRRPRREIRRPILARLARSFHQPNGFRKLSCIHLHTTETLCKPSIAHCTLSGVRTLPDGKAEQRPLNLSLALISLWDCRWLNEAEMMAIALVKLTCIRVSHIALGVNKVYKNTKFQILGPRIA